MATVDTWTVLGEAGLSSSGVEALRRRGCKTVGDAKKLLLGWGVPKGLSAGDLKALGRAQPHVLKPEEMSHKQRIDDAMVRIQAASRSVEDDYGSLVVAQAWCQLVEFTVVRLATMVDRAVSAGDPVVGRRRRKKR